MKCFKLVLSYRKLNATHSLIACITMYMPPYMAIVSRLAFSSQVKHLQMATNHTKLCSHTPHNHNNKFSRKFPRLCSESHSFRTYVCIRLYCFIAISSNNLVKNTIPMCLRVCVCFVSLETASFDSQPLLIQLLYDHVNFEMSARLLSAWKYAIWLT